MLQIAVSTFYNMAYFECITVIKNSHLTATLLNNNVAILLHDGAVSGRERDWQFGQKDERTIAAHRTGSHSGFQYKGVGKEYT